MRDYTEFFVKAKELKKDTFTYKDFEGVAFQSLAALAKAGYLIKVNNDSPAIYKLSDKEYHYENTPKGHGERQAHGFKYQNYCADQYGINVNGYSYTHKWDANIYNHFCSIKSEQNYSDIELGSLKRQSEITEDFFMFVGFWEQNKDNIVDEHILYINGEEWHKLFDPKLVDDSLHILTLVTNEHEDDEKWKQLKNEDKKKWEAKQSLIRPRYKRDHKNQKRMQCAINYSDFFNYFLPRYEISREEFENFAKRNKE